MGTKRHVLPQPLAAAGTSLCFAVFVFQSSWEKLGPAAQHHGPAAVRAGAGAGAVLGQSGVPTELPRDTGSPRGVWERRVNKRPSVCGPGEDASVGWRPGGLLVVRRPAKA